MGNSYELKFDPYVETAKINGAHSGGLPWKSAEGWARLGAHLASDGALDKVYLSACLSER